MYSVTGKEWTLALKELSLVIFSVNIHENWHEDTYIIHKYICKIKKIAADGNPEL